MPNPTIFEGINPKGTQEFIPCKDKAAVAWADAEKSVKKNLCVFNPYALELNSVVPTINTKTQKVTFNGTASEISWFGISAPCTGPNLKYTIHLKAGTYILSSPQASSLGSDSYIAVLKQTGNQGEQLATVGGSFSSTFTLAADTDVVIAVRFAKNKQLSNFAVQAMLTKSGVPQDYVLHIPDNTELFPRSEQAVLGAKNLLRNPFQAGYTLTNNGITFTVNADSSYSTNGTGGTGGSYLVFHNGENTILKKGERYIVSSGQTANGGVQIYYKENASDSWVQLASAVATEMEFIVPNNANIIMIRGYIGENNTVTNKVYYPMIRLASDPDDTYVPYAMTNKELTDDRYFHAGDTVNVSVTNFPALLTAAAKEIRCTIPFMKNLSKVTGFTFKSSTTIAVRKPSGGYLIDSLLSNYNVSLMTMRENFLCFKIEKTDDTAFDADNNCCLDLAFTGGSTDAIITFS